MPYSFHLDKERYFKMQRDVTLSHIIPFIQKSLPRFDIKNSKILEVGCGEAGVLQAFLEEGANDVVGIELSDGRVEIAKSLLRKKFARDRFSIVCKNIHDASVITKYEGAFDLIVLKDVIEHIHNRPAMMKTLKLLLKPNGVIFFGFPPWQMPFGGHQQNSTSHIIKVTPWIHLLPLNIYLGLVRVFDKRPGISDGFKKIRDTSLSIEQYEKLVKESGYVEIARVDYLTNPIYRYKFNLPVLEQLKMIRRVQGFRNVVTTCIYSIVRPISI